MHQDITAPAARGQGLRAVGPIVDRLAVTADLRHDLGGVRGEEIPAVRQLAAVLGAHGLRPECDRSRLYRWRSRGPGYIIQWDPLPRLSPWTRYVRLDIWDARIWAEPASPRAIRARRALAEILALLQAPRVSRIDVAIDFPVSFLEVQVLRDRHRSRRVVRRLRGVRVGEYVWVDRWTVTQYSGARRGPIELCMYDRAGRERERGRVPPWPVCTRIEARVRPSPRLQLTELSALPDPYAGLRVCALSPLDAGDSAGDYARLHGVHALRPLYPARRWRRMLDDMERAAAEARIPHPSQVYAPGWPAVARHVLGVLGVESDDYAAEALA